ncbi:AAA family ATPase [Bradyrhizobium sp. STM 3562]|uniref:AAA family ATPase n=1 Tax=Bradyrhizobium sp. STM 3562 TaxID=578924 RepID=UPI00388D9ADA
MSSNGGALSSQTEDGVGALVNFTLGFLRRQYLVIILTAALAMAGCVIYLKITPPTYTAQVQILLANNKAQFVQQQSLVAEPTFDLSQIETQLQILKSRGIAVAVINKLDLANDPDLNRPGSPLLSLLHQLRVWIAPPPERPQSSTPDQPPEAVINAFQDRLGVGRVSVSNVIELSYSASTAQRAAEIVNAIAKAYIADLVSAKSEANRSATGWLQERLRALGEQALAAERAVSAYKSQHNIVSPGGKPIDDQQITDLNSRLVAARAQSADILAKLNRYEAILRVNSENSQTIGTLDAASVDTLNSPIITNLRQQYLELARRESEWSARFGHNHMAVVNLRMQMQQLRTSILDEVRRLAEISRSELEVAKQKQQDVERQLAGAVSQSRSTSSAELTIRELETRAKELRNLYETFLQRYMGSMQQESFPVSETRVISPASPPQNKSKPKPHLVMAFGAIGGLVFGIGLGFLREIMDRVFRTPTQLEGTLDLPCLTLVPRLRDLNVTKQTVSSRNSCNEVGPRLLSNRSAVHRAIVGMPLSRFVEAIRSIKLAIDLNPGRGSNHVIGITSALPNEGKTTIAASLAELIGHSGKKVLIVDCDLRNPSLSASLAPDASAGLVEVLNGTHSVEETLWRDPKTNLAFLPAVLRSPLFHTSEILADDAIRNLFDGLRASYDYIIVDLPPLTPLVDVRVTAPLIDSFILVVEWGRTKIDVVQHALHTAPTICECLIGTVLNKTDIKAMARYDSYCSDYYSDSHYVHYGLSGSKASAMRTSFNKRG